jgi:hypothetical protein
LLNRAQKLKQGGRVLSGEVRDSQDQKKAAAADTCGTAPHPLAAPILDVGAFRPSF